MTRLSLPCSRRIIRRYRRSEGGVTAIEFAMVAPPFLALMMAIFEVGIMLFSEYVIEHGVNQAARMIRTGEVYEAEITTASQFKGLVCGKLAKFLDCETRLRIAVRAFDNFAEVTKLSPLTEGGELSLTEDAFDPGKPYIVTSGSSPDSVVVVNVYYVWSLFTPGMTLMSNMSDGRRLLAAGAAFRNEPYADN